MSKLADFREIAYERARNFRDKYNLGNYCANQLLEILDLLEQDERINIELIRTPFENIKLAGFIGYKHDTFVIVTNTNLTLGNERFTIAHEIYHLLQNRVYIKKNSIIEEMVDNDDEDVNELMANCFATELLMPKEDIEVYINKMTLNQTKDIDFSTVIKFQQKYGVDYVAITKRLKEVGVIEDNKKQELEAILNTYDDLEKLTKNLGYKNDLNIPSQATLILQRDLEVLKANFDNGDTTYDDLVRIFGYLGCEPEKFGYESHKELTDAAKNFMDSLLE
ncbi:MAG: ImmA/IrrE family metallo-endopeptidase [Anaeromicrobium sp.]|nr:ImmA/IrrE family metallo-endopeptidase [Anaeromicrobium sp.]MCT4592948.1 ImmA/IrrE family metallo-endopeptidase [Anaeromicrobium sp.]